MAAVTKRPTPDSAKVSVNSVRPSMKMAMVPGLSEALSIRSSTTSETSSGPPTNDLLQMFSDATAERREPM